MYKILALIHITIMKKKLLGQSSSLLRSIGLLSLSQSHPVSKAVLFASFQVFPIFSSSFNLGLVQLYSCLPCFTWPCEFQSNTNVQPTHRHAICLSCMMLIPGWFAPIDVRCILVMAFYMCRILLFGKTWIYCSSPDVSLKFSHPHRSTDFTLINIFLISPRVLEKKLRPAEDTKHGLTYLRCSWLMLI